MSKKSDNTTGIGFKEIAITSCLLTILSPSSAVSADTNLTQTNENLQKIFKQMKEKYAAHDAQQTQQAAQAQAAMISPEPTNQSQNFDDTPSSSIPSATTSDLYLSPSNNDSRFAAGEELILSTSINGYELTSIFALKTETGLQIGIGDFFQIVELPIYTDLKNVSAEGWFKQETNQFSLKRLSDGRLHVKANGKNYYINTNDYRVDDDIFIGLDDLKNWFGLDYTLNEEQLTLAISTTEKLPVQLRLARLNKPGLTKMAAGKSVLPLKESPYKAFTTPLLDIQLSAQEAEWVLPPLTNTSNDNPRISRQKSNNYSILANQNLAYLDAELFLAGNNQDSLNTARLTLSRQSDQADLLGPLHATEYAVGDVTPVNAGFGNTLGLSRGLSLNNTPLNQLADNRKVNIVGPIQEGWDVELYRNGVLIDQNIGISNGRYEFNDIALDYGNNDFELIMYGPQGQIETKTESYIVDSNNVTSGQGMYRFSLVEIGQSVFDTNDYSDDPTQQGIMASSVFDYGITDWLALNLGTSTFEPELGDTQQFFTLGANATLGNTGLLSAQYLQNNDKLKSANLSYRTRVLNTSYNFNAQRTEEVDPVLSTTTHFNQYDAAMSGNFFSNSWLPINYQNNWQLTQYSDQTKNETFQNAVGISSKLGYFSNSLAWQKNDSASLIYDPALAVSSEQVSGALQYRKNFGRLTTRLFSAYDVKPIEEVTAYGTTLNYNWTPNLNSELRYSHLTVTDNYQVNLGMNWRKDAFYLNTNAGYNEDGSWSGSIGLRFSLGYEPQGQSIFTSSRPMAQSGAVSARVFEDLNMNGIFDTNERPIENATVKAVQAYRQEKTNASGVAVLSSLYNNTTTDIVVDESTLDGPFMITAIPGVAIKARKGYVETVELPVVKAGEVEGVIYLKGIAGESDVAPYIMLNLVDKNEKVVATTRSEYDGYYLFTSVKPGSYSLKVDENYIDRRGLKTANKNLDFSSNGDVIAGVDFVLRPLDAASGYVASAGHFNSPALLKLYYHILRNKLGGQFAQTPFYIKKPDKGGYILGLAYYPGLPAKNTDAQRKAQQACSNLAKSKVYCDVQYHDFKY